MTIEYFFVNMWTFIGWIILLFSVLAILCALFFYSLYQSTGQKLPEGQIRNDCKVLAIVLFVAVSCIGAGYFLNTTKWAQKVQIKHLELKIRDHIADVESKKRAAKQLGLEYKDVGISDRYGGLVYTDTKTLSRLNKELQSWRIRYAR